MTICTHPNPPITKLVAWATDTNHQSGWKHEQGFIDMLCCPDCGAVVDVSPDRTDYITVTNGMSGYFAVHMQWNEEFGGFWEPYDTGFGRYPTDKGAKNEARQWAEETGIRLSI